MIINYTPDVVIRKKHMLIMLDVYMFLSNGKLIAGDCFCGSVRSWVTVFGGLSCDLLWQLLDTF